MPVRAAPTPQPAMQASLMGVSRIRPGNFSGIPLNWPKMPAWAVRSSPRMKTVSSRAISSCRASARAADALRILSAIYLSNEVVCFSVGAASCRDGIVAGSHSHKGDPSLPIGRCSALQPAFYEAITDLHTHLRAPLPAGEMGCPWQTRWRHPARISPRPRPLWTFSS